MLRNALRIFSARFMRRNYWVAVDSGTNDYSVAWMDAPWRALPVSAPTTVEEAEGFNKILKEHLALLERYVVKDYTAKIYRRQKEDWFELFLVTFICQVILSEKLEMSFWSRLDGLVSYHWSFHSYSAEGCARTLADFFVKDEPIECPWSTFGGLRSYSSKRIASFFLAINGQDPFLKPDAVNWDGFGEVEKRYLSQCAGIVKGGCCLVQPRLPFYSLSFYSC
jgi:hypothetical protein